MGGVIEKDDLRILDGPIGPFDVMHKCHLPQEETKWGKEALARNPGGFDGSGRTLIVGYNPCMVRIDGAPKARCAYCRWEASDECQRYLNTLM
jgi:hypothetical protein